MKSRTIWYLCLYLYHLPRSRLQRRRYSLDVTAKTYSLYVMNELENGTYRYV